MKKLLLAVAVLVLVSGRASADLVFDNFNINEGHFTSNVTTASGSNVAMESTSTADRVTTDAREGLGSQKLTLVHNSTTSAQRLRHLSGAGTPASNTVFTTTSSPGDGFIGFWLKADTPGWTVQLALDGPLPDLQGGVPRTVIADNTWRCTNGTWTLQPIGAPLAGSLAIPRSSKAIRPSTPLFFVAPQRRT